MSKTSKRPEIVPHTLEEDAAIVAAALADPDAQPLSDEQLKAMVPMRLRCLMPYLSGVTRRRGALLPLPAMRLVALPRQ